jgi:hypothetical protein
MADDNHIQVKGNLTLDPLKDLSMEGLTAAIQRAYPRDPSLTVVGISVPLLNIECKIYGIIDPITDIKDAVSRIYTTVMQAITKPIWTVLYGLYNVLKRFGLAFLDLKLPVLNLHISDLFNPNLYDVVKKAVVTLYNKAKSRLDPILKILDIPKILKDIQSPEKEIEYFVKSIVTSLWDVLMKKINLIKDLIQRGLELYDILMKGLTQTALTWRTAVNAALKTVINFLQNPPSIQQIYDKLVAYAKRLYKRIPTSEDIMNAIKSFRLPIIGKIFDWVLPLNLKVNFPTLDLAKMLSDMKLFIQNFVLVLLKKFIQMVQPILKLFGLFAQFLRVHLPITLCAVKQTV